MLASRILLLLTAVLLATSLIASAQQAPADQHDAELAYAQCIRDNGYEKFPDPEPEGFKFLIAPEDVTRFKAAGVACRDLAPEGMRDEGVTPEQLDALIKLSQCIRDNGIPEFPDPDSKGGYDLRNTGIQPGDGRVDAAMAACNELVGMAGRIAIGG